MVEIWKDIEGYEGLYQVSNFGRVRSLDRVVFQQGREQLYKGCIMTPYVNNKGYYAIRLSKDNHKRGFSVHRLVAQAFIPNPLGLPEVNHINENKLDENVNNLEWCTRVYNVNYGTGTHRRAIKCGIRVAQYNRQGKLVNVYYSAKEAERRTGISKASILSCINKRNVMAGYFFWLNVKDGEAPLFYKAELAKNSARVVNQYDAQLNFIASFKSSRDAAKATGLNHENICACCRGVSHSCGGYIWRYEGDKPSILVRSNQHEVIQYDLNMNEMQRFPSIAAASKKLGGGKDAGIKQCIYGKNKTAYGFKWRYADT